MVLWWVAAWAGWHVESPAWSNAGPVAFADMACAVAEPNQVWCVDLETGETRWVARQTYADTLAGPEAADHAAAMTAAASRRAQAHGLQARYAALRRGDAQVAPGEDLVTVLRGISEEVTEIWAELDTIDRREARVPREIVGYTSHPPVADAERMYVLTGQGVVAAYSPDGARVWTRYLGPPATPLRGYEVGTAAPPLRRKDVLIVPHGQLTALDAATGEVRWQANPYRDFGGPVWATVDGVDLVITPAGEVVRASDGHVLEVNLPEVWFTRPIVSGSVITWVGGQDAHAGRPNAFDALATQVALSWEGETLVATERWRHDIVLSGPVYTAPVRVGEQVWLADASGQVWTVDLADGALTSVVDMTDVGVVYGGPAVHGDRVWWTGESGRLFGVSTVGRPVVVHTVPPLRSTPLVRGDTLVLRTLDGLRRLEVP